MTIEAAALEFCNFVRSCEGLHKVNSLNPGIRGHSKGCVVARTIGYNCEVKSNGHGNYVGGIWENANGGIVECGSGRQYAWTSEATKFIDKFDGGQFPHLELERD
jgi:hypothetical protein